MKKFTPGAVVTTNKNAVAFMRRGQVVATSGSFPWFTKHEALTGQFLIIVTTNEGEYRNRTFALTEAGMVVEMTETAHFKPVH